jgi:hypothetical protein
MKSVVPKSSLGSEFDHFLFAPLGEDHNGLPVSVVSLFARMDLDPWQEAGNLAALSSDAAARRLSASLDTLTDPTLRPANPQGRVLRLLALLPSHVGTTVQTPVATAGAVATGDSATRIRTILFIACAILLVGSQLLSAPRPTPTPPGADPGQAVGPVASQGLSAPPPGH